MQDLTDSRKRQLREEVCREFPEDEVMQQVHYVRLLHSLKMEGISAQERVRFFQAENLNEENLYSHGRLG